MSTDIDEVETWLEGRELLGRAVSGVPVPTAGGGTEAVFARARQRRVRRRAAVSGVAAAVAVLGVAFGPGAFHEGREKSAPGTRSASREDEFKKLLPAGIDRVQEVDRARITQPDVDWDSLATAGPKTVKRGPYDGTYAVFRDGGVGYITVQTLSDTRRNWDHSDPCHVYRFTLEKCTSEPLPGGDDLLVFIDLASEHVTGGNRYGAELTVEQYRSGRMVLVEASSGFQGKGALGPRLDTPPLTKDQLRALVQLPQLQPGPTA